jgi:hypothetical protein
MRTLFVEEQGGIFMFAADYLALENWAQGVCMNGGRP